MNNNLADVTLVVDRSGSMASCKDEAQNGINHFIEEQKKQEGEAVFSLIQFDTDYDFVHRGVPIDDVPPFELQPRGMTALLDALGMAINETGERLSRMLADDRPGLVVFVIVTDGQDNSSHEFSTPQIRELITRQTSDYQWQFTFLGANQDAFAEAAAIGIPGVATVSYSPRSSRAAFAGTANSVCRMRSATSGGRPAAATYTNDERAAMKH